MWRVPPDSAKWFPQLQEPSSPSPRSQPKDPKPKIPRRRSKAKDPNSRSQAKDIKPKFQSQRFQAKNPKPKSPRAVGGHAPISGLLRDQSPQSLRMSARWDPCSQLSRQPPPLSLPSAPDSSVSPPRRCTKHHSEKGREGHRFFSNTNWDDFTGLLIKNLLPTLKASGTTSTGLSHGRLFMKNTMQGGLTRAVIHVQQNIQNK